MSTIQRHMSLKAWDTLWFYIFALPGIIGLLVFKLVPLIASAWLSLTNYSVLGGTRFIGAYNYTSMFDDEMFWVSLKNTLYYVGVSVPLGLVFR